MKYTIVALIAFALVLGGYALGHHNAVLAGDMALAEKQSAWDGERATLAAQRADAVNAQLIAQHARDEALNKAAQAYEEGKTDAHAEADRAIAALDAGTRRLRDQWATCRATTDAVSAAASGAGEPDGAAGLREDGIRRVLSAVGQCQAQRDALQQALMADRAQPTRSNP